MDEMPRVYGFCLLIEKKKILLKAIFFLFWDKNKDVS